MTVTPFNDRTRASLNSLKPTTTADGRPLSRPFWHVRLVVDDSMALKP